MLWLTSKVQPLTNIKSSVAIDNISGWICLCVSGQTVSTVSEERQFNQRLNKGLEEFVDIMNKLNLKKPAKIGIKHSNSNNNPSYPFQPTEFFFLHQNILKALTPHCTVLHADYWNILLITTLLLLKTVCFSSSFTDIAVPANLVCGIHEVWISCKREAFNQINYIIAKWKTFTHSCPSRINQNC